MPACSKWSQQLAETQGTAGTNGNGRHLFINQHIVKQKKKKKLRDHQSDFN